MSPEELRPLEERVLQSALVWAERFGDRYGPEVDIGSDDADLLEACAALHQATAKVLREQSGVL